MATYRGSGFINLSTGAITRLGGYAFWSLNSGKTASFPYAVALPLALIFVLAVATLLEFVVYRPLRNTSPLVPSIEMKSPSFTTSGRPVMRISRAR